MNRDEFEEAVRELATAVACGRGRSERARNLAGEILAVWAKEATARSAAARKAALSRWRGSGGDAEPMRSTQDASCTASENADADGLSRTQDASQNACSQHANGVPCKAVSSLLSSPDQEETQQLPRLVSSPPASQLLVAPPEKLSNARPRKPPQDTSVAWAAYAVEYRRRYGISPTRNARGNGQLAQFMRRIPLEDVAVTVTHYVRSQNQRYVASGHSIGNLLHDAEKLRTEALTGRAGTIAAATRADKTADRTEQYIEMLARLEAEGTNGR